jgi:hypothetical protein
MSPNVVWIVASLASSDRPVCWDVMDVATVCFSHVGCLLKMSQSRLDLSLRVDLLDILTIQANA